MLIAENLTQPRGRKVKLHNFSFTFDSGRCYALVGPSQAGKTTLLRLLAALDKPATGRVYVNQKLVKQPSAQVGCVWANPHVFANTVMANMVYGLRWRQMGARRRQERAYHLLGSFDLQPKRKAWAPHLARSEQIRMVFARTLAPRPSVMLVDEPITDLDHYSLRIIESVLQQTQKTDGMTILITTNNVAQIQRLADEVLVLANGHLVETGPTADLLAAPHDEVTRRFLLGTP